MRRSITNIDRVGECVVWIIRIMGGYSWTDADLTAAATTAGFTAADLRGAKSHLRHADPPLYSQPRGRVWVNWIGGERGTPNVDRPPSAARTSNIGRPPGTWC